MDEASELVQPGRMVRTQPPVEPVHGPTTLANSLPPDNSPVTADATEIECSLTDIESAYRRALEVVEAVEWPQAEEPSESSAAFDFENPARSSTNADASTIRTSIPAPPPGDSASSTDSTPAVTGSQIIEAVMFVGGHPVTAKRLCSLLGGQQEVSDIEQLIDELNAQFTAQNRPYEIRLGEGGYRLDLLPDFEPIRSRVYGLGPREVKLSQDVLEVLSLVAYKQPITRTEIEKYADEGAANILRQLLRRDLIAIQRGESRDDVMYVTTDRFLSVFGLARLDDLPRADELDVK
jgi:segregation and condensation protein B